MTNTTTPAFTAATLDVLEETGTNWRDDLDALRGGDHNAESLLEYCLDGADEDRHEAWRDYVTALTAVL